MGKMTLHFLAILAWLWLPLMWATVCSASISAFDDKGASTFFVVNSTLGLLFTFGLVIYLMVKNVVYHVNKIREIAEEKANN